ncbi:hypothetical protein ACWDYH_01860 [Nocardia goodfellowii]
MNQHFEGSNPATAPWKVANTSPGRYRFTNNTGKVATMVFFQKAGIVGVQLRTEGLSLNSVDGRFEHGESFNVEMTRLPNALGSARVEVEWRFPYGGDWVKRTWTYLVPG